jgi:hypothetical protein
MMNSIKDFIYCSMSYLPEKDQTIFGVMQKIEEEKTKVNSNASSSFMLA